MTKNKILKTSRCKNTLEKNNYKDFIKYSKISPDDTAGVINPNLIGSNILNNDNDKYNLNQKPVPAPVKVTFKKWFSEYKFEIIIISIIIPMVFLIINIVMGLQTNIAISTVKIDQLKETVQTLTTDNVTKEMLNLQLDSLKRELKNEMKMNDNEFENRLDIIEKQIEKIIDK